MTVIICKLCDEKKAEYHGYCFRCWMQYGKQEITDALKTVKRKIKREKMKW